MAKFKKYIPVLLLLLIILFIAVTCKKEKYDDVTYYKTIGIGYVFMYDSEVYYPVHGAEITVSNCLKGGYSGFFGNGSPDEIFTTDETGQYQVRFVKRTKFLDVWKYRFHYGYPEERNDNNNNYYYLKDKDIILYPDDIINAQNNTIVFDTIKLNRNE